MSLPNYPVPALDVTLQEVSRVLQLSSSPAHYSDFVAALDQQGAELGAAHRQLVDGAALQENWVTGQFKSGLLSSRDPLPTATALPVLLLPSTGGRSQLPRAAALLWAAATLHSQPILLEGHAPLERSQQAEVFAATRLPGQEVDRIQVYPDSLHAVVSCGGGVFPVNILTRSSAGGPLSPLPLADVYQQLVEVASCPAMASDDLKTDPQTDRTDPLAVCRLSALERHSWFVQREALLRRGDTVRGSLELMESAVLTLSLEEGPAPKRLDHALNAVRLGVADGPPLRYYDKVLNVVVFRDATAGMVFEHSAVDGMVAGLVTERLYQLSETADFSAIHNVSVNGVKPASPAPLLFPAEGIPSLSGDLKQSHPVLTFDVSSYPDVFSALRSQRGLYDAWINFSLQLSLRQTLGQSAAQHILVTPTHVRHFKHGRCDPTYSVTLQSLRLVSAMAAGVSLENAIPYSTELLRLFHIAFLDHKRLIKRTKEGEGVGPHLAALRRSLPPDNPLKTFLSPFACPSVYLTGTDLVEGVECGVGNVYAQDQLAVTYLGKTDKVRIVINGKGSFVPTLERLQDNLKVNLKAVMLLALRYAIASQMGGLESLLHDGARERGDGERVHRQGSQDGSKRSPNSNSGPPNSNSGPPNSNSSRDCSLVIHGGAGEEMMLDSQVIGVIEFALQVAVTLGSEVLQRGGRSLDAVERSVEALENCFLFNAGKGAVFNKDGKTELEAAIVDGAVLRSGSVACLKSVKNPIKAARCVMEKSSHALIVGDGAEEFLGGLERGEEPVQPEYFHTDIRHKQLMLTLSGGVPRNNHPQTVGAVALDRSNALAAASSTGGVVGKLKGRVGDTAVVGAGIYADDKLAIACSGDGDVFLRNTVAQKIASLYRNKGHSLRQACREVMEENLKGVCAGIIAVDAKGEAVVETNAGVMFVASVVGGVTRVEVARPLRNVSHVIWETDELVAFLNPKPWIPGSVVLSRKTVTSESSIFDFPAPDFAAMLQGARVVSRFLCERLEVQRVALVCSPTPGEPPQIKLLPLHGLEARWQPHLSGQEEFHPHHPGYCTSKSGPRCNDEDLAEVQTRIRNALPTPNAPFCYDFHGEPSCQNLFSRIVRGEQQQWRVWEDGEHVAFLTPFPNSPGLTVVVPRRRLTSDIFRLSDPDFSALMSASYKVAKLLQAAMKASGVAVIFEGFEIDYAHVKLIPLIPPPDSTQKPAEKPSEFVQNYPGYVSSLDGPTAEPQTLKDLHSRITGSRPPRSWEDPQTHASLAIQSRWYRNLFQIQNTLFHSTVEYFHSVRRYAYALTPFTTDTISSPMGLGSDSEPVSVNLMGRDVYLADSMQFVLEYFLRFQEDLAGTYYVSPSFRGEDPDATHLNQFYHVECELRGDMDLAISVAEGYVAHLTRSMLKKHPDLILSAAGSLDHINALLDKLDGGTALPRVTLEDAVPMMPSADCVEWVQDGQPLFGRKLTRKGERVLMERFGGPVWLTEMDHLGVPFYQAYVDGSGRSKAKAADLLLGLGETVGLGERHSTAEMVREALRHHAVPEQSYRWYLEMRRAQPIRSSGWGMGTERYLCWLLQHDDVRDMQIIPRMKGAQFMP